jgi:hypothetical protein
MIFKNYLRKSILIEKNLLDVLEIENKRKSLILIEFYIVCKRILIKKPLINFLNLISSF